MQSTFMLTLAEIRKNRKQMLSQMIIIFFASTLLNLGLLTAINFGGYFDSRARELNAAHAIFVFSEQQYNDRYLRYFRQREDVTATQKDEILSLNASLKMPVSNLDIRIFGIDYDNMGVMNQVQLVGETLQPDNRSIYVPYVLQFSGGLTLGSTLGIGLNEDPNDPSKEVVYEFTVAGFTEDIMYGATNVDALGMYFPRDVYRTFSGQLSEYFKGIMLSAQLSNPANSTAMSDEFYNEELDGEDVTTWSIDIDAAKMDRTSISNILAAIVVAFSVIIQLVSQIVIRFRIGDAIETGMRNYGALKALGYTATQIIFSIVLQFTVTTVFVCIAGIAFSYVTVGAMSGLLVTETGLNWVQGFDASVSAISFIFIIAVTATTAFFTASKLKKTPPIDALKGGSALNTVRYNILQIEKTEMPLTFMLAAKTTFINIKQNLLIALIMASVSIALVFGIVMAYNTPAPEFINTFVGQFPELSLSVGDKADAYEIRNEVLKMDGVTKAVITNFGSNSAVYDGQKIGVTTMEDFSELLNPSEIYQGRPPVHPNEVVLGGMLAESQSVKIGDVIRMSVLDRSEDYIITGFLQNENNGGRNAFMTTEGYRLLYPDYRESEIGVVIPKELDIYQFIDELEERYDEKVTNVSNWREMMNIEMSSILEMVYSLCGLIVVITALVIIFLLFLVVRTLVLRRRQELGIQKALGFTTFQLMSQIAGSFVPVAVIGTGTGSAIGCLLMDTLIELMFEGSGIMKMHMVIPVPLIVTAAVLLCLLTYSVSLIVSVRIRKITAYALLTE